MNPYGVKKDIQGAEACFTDQSTFGYFYGRSLVDPADALFQLFTELENQCAGLNCIQDVVVVQVFMYFEGANGHMAAGIFAMPQRWVEVQIGYFDNSGTQNFRSLANANQ